MAIWPFNRRQQYNDSTLPPEVRAYSQAERREKMGMAWLVGVISLVVSAAVLTGLFFGGRWIYRKIAGNDNKNNTSVSQNEDKNNQDKSQAEKDKADAEAAKAREEEARKKSEAEAKQKADAEAKQKASQAQTPTTTTPATGNDLPRTGPDLDL